MDELYIQLCARFKRVTEVTSLSVQGQAFRQLKDQEKVRCEKENFLLNMLKISRSLSNEQKLQAKMLKREYFKKSLLMMQTINRNFSYEQPSDESVSQNFLDCFVGLYKTFFQIYEESLQFKTRIKNFLRPTNHNIITDLVKYLVDFSRDYYQQTVMWQTRQRSSNVPSTASTPPTATPPEQPIMNKTNSERLRRLKPISMESDLRSKKATIQDIWRNYDIMEVIPVSCPIDQSLSTEIIRLRLNEIFRDCKLRNATCRLTIEKFRQRMPAKYEKNQNFDNNFPVNISLTVDRNGMTALHVEKTRSFSKQQSKESLRDVLKAEKAPSLLATQTNFGQPVKLTNQQMFRPRNATSDYLLSSLKILRMSDNFLPPLVLQTKPQKTQKNIEEVLLRRQSNEQVRYYNAEGQPDIGKLRLVKRNYSPRNSATQNGQAHLTLHAEQRLLQWLSKIKGVKQMERKRVQLVKDD